MSKRGRTSSHDDDDDDTKILKTTRYTSGQKRKTYDDDDDDLVDSLSRMTVDSNKRTLADISQPNTAQLREKRVQYYEKKFSEKGGRKRRKTKRIKRHNRKTKRKN
jgi:hypothetical protein